MNQRVSKKATFALRVGRRVGSKIRMGGDWAVDHSFGRSGEIYMYANTDLIHLETPQILH